MKHTIMSTSKEWSEKVSEATAMAVDMKWVSDVSDKHYQGFYLSK